MFLGTSSPTMIDRYVTSTMTMPNPAGVAARSLMPSAIKRSAISSPKVSKDPAKEQRATQKNETEPDPQQLAGTVSTQSPENRDTRRRRRRSRRRGSRRMLT